MFIELKDTTGNTRYVNTDYIQEIVYNKQHSSWKIVFPNGCSYFTDYNIDKLIGQKKKTTDKLFTQNTKND